MEDLTITETLTIPARELGFTAVASGGPGGQNVNKVATKVLLRWDLPHSEALPEWARDRVRALAGARRLDGEGCILISCSTTRSQDRNLELARERLAALIRDALARPRTRRATRPSRAAKARRVDAKRRQGEKKQGRRPDHD
ncbi:alternative ribosome rescue aminoacyl-tRNA hydrolase ArfB [Nannocystaceae bacterium ST9]